MKAEIEFKVDKEGNPMICFKHHERADSIEHTLLGVFINNALEYGLKIGNPTGHLKCGTTECWEDYEIRAKQQSK